MQFSVITIFPDMFRAINYGVIGRAQNQGIININYWNPRDYTNNHYRKVDDHSYGGGSGMVMMVQPLINAIQAARNDGNNGIEQIIYLTPQGKLLDDELVKSISKYSKIILVAGRYEGIDERVMKIEPGLEISIGDYVLSGGELPAMVLIDTISRQLPGVIGSIDSVHQDSFCNGLLDYPHYTRPKIIYNLRVPEVLLNGNHSQISIFRKKQALGRTWLRRPELLQNITLNKVDKKLLNEFINELE